MSPLCGTRYLHLEGLLRIRYIEYLFDRFTIIPGVVVCPLNSLVMYRIHRGGGGEKPLLNFTIFILQCVISTVFKSWREIIECMNGISVGENKCALRRTEGEISGMAALPN